METFTTRWRIIQFIRNFVQQKGYAPTIGEIQRSLNISSKSVVRYHLKALEEEGLINREPQVTRGIDVLGVGKRARAVPLLGSISAGEPMPVATQETWYTIARKMVDVPADMLPINIDAYALRVNGNSMTDALVDDGDIVILETTSTAENGQMVAAWLKDKQETTLKRLYVEPGRIRLQPANRAIGPIYCRPEEVEILGRVVGVIRKLLNSDASDAIGCSKNVMGWEIVTSLQ